MRLSEFTTPPTIMSATDSNGQVDRAKADTMVDPRVYFAKNKRRIKKKSTVNKS